MDMVDIPDDERDDNRADNDMNLLHNTQMDLIKNKQKELHIDEKVRKNILYAKKYMVESIYRAANVEGLGFTFPETQSICDGMSVAGHPIEDVEAVVDLKHAWQWIFENYDKDTDLEMLKTLNRISGKYTVINAGHLRDRYDEPIRVPLGDDKYYYPEIPDEERISKRLKEISENEDAILAALDMFCYVAKLQAFNDGNKRTATLISNVILIQNGRGIMSIPKEKIKDFYDCLVEYYASDNMKNLKDFLLEQCYIKID